MNKKGQIYEDIAVNYLRNKGYKIIDKNFSVPKIGEIDIIAKKDDWIIFVEVKARKKTYYKPYESINKSKIKRIIKTSAIYLKKYNTKYNGIRYDVISIEENEKNNYNLEHIENAFEVKEGYYL